MHKIGAHSQLSRSEQDATGVSEGYVRLSVGLEHIDDIIADLDRGFAAVGGIRIARAGLEEFCSNALVVFSWAFCKRVVNVTACGLE